MNRAEEFDKIVEDVSRENRYRFNMLERSIIKQISNRYHLHRLEEYDIDIMSIKPHLRDGYEYLLNKLKE